jgi:hypothetical protein
MNLPPGWSAQLTQTGAVVARGGDGGSTVVIAPVLGAGKVDAADWLRQRGAGALGAYLRNASVAAVYPSRASRNAALAVVDYAAGNGPGTAHVLCFMAGNIGTVYAVAAPKQSFAQQSGALVGILKSFSFSGERSASAGGGGAQGAPDVQFTKATDPNEGSFSVDVPQGWKSQLGTIRKSTIDVRSFVYTTSPDGLTIIRIGDPDIGGFSIPTSTMAQLGMREGSPYNLGAGNVLMVRRYVPGQQFAVEYVGKLVRDSQLNNVQMKASKPRPEFNARQSLGPGQQQAVAGDASFSAMRNGHDVAGTVVAATTLTSMPGIEGGTWHVTALVTVVAPPERVAAANRILDHMIRSFRVSAQWSQQQQQTTMETSRIVSETNDRISQIISDSYWARQKVYDRTNRNFSDYIRGTVHLRDPNDGEELEGVAGKNYYYRVPNDNKVIGSDQVIQDPDFHELELVR